MTPLVFSEPFMSIFTTLRISVIMSGVAAYFLVYMSNQIVLQTFSYIKQVFTVNWNSLGNEPFHYGWIYEECKKVTKLRKSFLKSPE